MTNAQLLDVLGYTPEQIAEAELLKLAEDTNAQMGPYAKANNTLEGFTEFVAMHDAMIADE